MDLSWYELRCEYEESNKKIKNAKKELKDVFSAQAIADKEILGNMIGEGNKMMKVLNQKILYEFSTLSEDELSVLTGLQRQVAILKQVYSFSKIAEILGIPPTTVFDQYQKALRRVDRERRNKIKGIPSGLSKQQEEIYLLHVKEKKPKEIAEILGTTPGNVRKQLAIIKQKCYQKPECAGSVSMCQKTGQLKEVVIS